MAAAVVGLALLSLLGSGAPPTAASSHCASQDSAARIRDCRTLIDLKGDLDPNGRLNWSETLPMTSWEGVFSSAENGVSTLEVYQKELNGTVPAGLGSLPNLRFLRLWGNGLTGSIPAELGNLSNLEELRLDQNALTGSIPTGLGSLRNLTSMSLSINQLSGGIPSDFGNLSSLDYLSLDRNFLGLVTHPTAGSPAPNAVQNPIPASLGNLSTLGGLSLSDNNFAGSIPAALGNLSNLESLYLDSNNFSGNIPTALGNLSKLEVLTAAGNQLSGSIPSQLGNLAALEQLSLYWNELTGSIPAGLGRLSKLEYLQLSENQLSGSIPSALGDLTELTHMFLDTNRLSGPIPPELGDLTQLRDLNLARNELSGAIPSELGDLTSLESFNLNDNGLSLDIPSELGDLQAVDYISLFCNFLTGNIPSELGDLPNLRILLLDRNKLNIGPGEVPTSLDSIGYVRLTGGGQCPRGQPDADPPSSDDVPPTFEMAELSRDGLTIVLTYNESLDSQNKPPTSAFTVKVDGQVVTVSTVDVRIREVRLGLGGAVTEDQGVTVAYTDPTSGDDEEAIQDRSGNDAANLSERTVTNESTVDDGVAPRFESASISSDGTTITLTYNEILNNGAGPGITNFQIVVEGERRDVSRVSVNDRQVELRLAIPITVGQTVVVSYFDPTTGDDGNAIQDRAGNDAADLIDYELTNTSTAEDERAPEFKRAAMSSDGRSITLVYDEVLDDEAGPVASDFSVEVDKESADLATSSAVSVNGRTVVLRLASAVWELQAVTVSYTDPTDGDDTNAIQDAAGNDAADLIKHMVTNASTVLDQQAPQFVSVSMSSDGTKITLTYDEVLDSENKPATANFAITVQGERRDVSAVTVSGKTVELGLGSAITRGQTVTVTYNDPTLFFDDLNAIQDRAGNDAASLIDEGVTNTSEVSDTTAPKFVRAVMSSNGWTITLVYDEVLDEVNKPATTDFTVTVDEDSADISSLDVSGRTVLLYLGGTVQSLQDVSMTYTDPTGDDDANAIQDAAGNDAVSLIDQEVANASTVVDERAPQFEDAATSSDGSKIILTYDEVLDSTNEPATANFAITVQGERRDVSTVTVSGKTVELELGSAVTLEQVVTVTYADPTAGVDDDNAIQDRAGNDAADLINHEVSNTSAVKDERAPGFVRAVISSDGITITLVYDEVLDDVNRPATTDFAATVAGQSAGITSVDVSGRTVLLQLDSPVTAGQTVKVTYTDPTDDVDDPNAIQDPAGNDAADLTEHTVINASTVPDETPPEFQSVAMSTDGLTITLTYDEALNSANKPATANFAITVQGERRGVSTVTVSGMTVALGLGTAITSEQVVTVTYTDPTADVDDTNAIQDLAGNDAANLSEPVTNASTVVDELAPSFVRAVMSSDGGTITLTYTEVLDDVNVPLNSDFTVAVDGESLDPSSFALAAIRGRTVVLGLDSVVTADQDVTVSYTDPTDGDDANAIQDPAGNDADDLVDQMVTNASTVPDERAPEFVSVSMSTDGTTITLTYDEDLDSQDKPRTGDFSVTVQGERRDVSTVTVSGKTVELGLGSAITSGQTVAIIYTDPTAGVDDRNAIQDSVGNDAASLTEPVTNTSTATDAQAPSFVSAETSTDGGRIILTFSEVLDSASGPSDSDFTVTVDEASVDLSSVAPVAVRGRTVVLGLDSAVTAGQDIKVTYTDPTDGNDTNAIQDPAGNDATSLTDQPVMNKVGQRPSPPRPSTPPPPRTPPSGSSSSPSPPPASRTWLDVLLTVPEGPIPVGETIPYTVTASNGGTVPLTGVTWRDVTSGSAPQPLSDLAAGGSVTATGSFGPVQTQHLPGIILTVAVDTDQTDERVASTFIAVTAEASEPPAQQVGLSGQPGGPSTRPRIPSSLVLRVVRTQFNVPDVHLAHNIPDLLLTLPDGSETTCYFLTHYENTGGLTRWGHTTSEVLEERPGSLTQYYQRGVVDCHEREGEWLMERRLTWDHFGGGEDGSTDLGVEPDLLSEQPGEQLGPWGHRVSNYAVDGTYTGFLDFFTALGGVPAFGYPKTEARYDNDPRRVLGIAAATQGFIRQYFQAAVMEYHPDTLSTIMLRLLGDDLRDRRYPDQLYATFASFGSVPPLRVGQIYVAELVTPSPEPAVPLTPPAPAAPASTPPVEPPAPPRLGLRVDRVLFSAPDIHLAHNIPDLTLTLANGSEATCGFLTYYEATHGLARWGHAISEVLEERSGALTQYFQRGVLDCHERDGEWRVERRLAWDYIGGGVEGAPDLGVEPDLLSEQPGELIGPWGHRVSNYAVDGTYTGFLDFFNALGGMTTFGYPKTEARYDDDPRAALHILSATRTVIRQYFQAAVLEYHPGDPFQPVKLHLLGHDLRDWRYPAYRAFVGFRSFGPLTQGQSYYPVVTSNVIRPAG